MDVLMKHKLLINSFMIFLILTLVFLISPSSSSSSSNQETRVSTQKTEPYLNGNEPPHQLVYIKKMTPFILNPRQRDQHRRLRYNHNYYYYRHSIRGRGLRHRANYFKMMTKKSSSNGFNRPVRPDTYSVMLPKGFVPPSGSSPCHNQINPNSATTLFCDLSTQP